MFHLVVIAAVAIGDSDDSFIVPIIAAIRTAAVVVAVPVPLNNSVSSRFQSVVIAHHVGHAGSSAPVDFGVTGYLADTGDDLAKVNDVVFQRVIRCAVGSAHELGDIGLDVLDRIDHLSFRAAIGEMAAIIKISDERIHEHIGGAFEAAGVMDQVRSVDRHGGAQRAKCQNGGGAECQGWGLRFHHSLWLTLVFALCGKGAGCVDIHKTAPPKSLAARGADCFRFSLSPLAFGRLRHTFGALQNQPFCYPIMTANELRQSFLDFFREKQHTIVPSASLMPTSPNLLFTNAGMNQFVPYFLGTENATYDPPRAADTQKCIRAGGKHNDLEDVGYDTYHHTFFEMLGNWSFGDYFKEEAIAWAWELIVERWGFPPERLYATVYKPGETDPAEFDQEAWDHWAVFFKKAGLDPDLHIVNGNAKDNFWAMGETGPCGPCSELHVDLTPNGDTKGSLVNMDDPRCIEIWNLVFIQFNCDEDKTYRPLPSQHVDTGMGFERACAIMQCTDGFKDFSKLASNYDTDVFAPIFEKLSEITGKSYTGTVPETREGLSEQEQIDVAFRVISDHIRTVSFSVADGILPGNKGRNSTIRAILRRAVRFGRELGLGGDRPFLHELIPVLIDHFSGAFPELKERQAKITEVITAEEAQFNKTLDRGLRLFDDAVSGLSGSKEFPPATVVKLWETFGFPLELTDVMLQEKGLATDADELQRLIDEHKQTGEEGQGPTVVSAVDIDTDAKSAFVGYDEDSVVAEVLELIEQDGQVIAIVDKSPLYVKKGGQLGDTGTASFGKESIQIEATSSVGDALCLHLNTKPQTKASSVTIQLNQDRRRDIEKHHTATHIMHWALHEAVDPEATQQGSLVAPDRLRFDFNSKALGAQQLLAVEQLVNEKVVADDQVSWGEVPHADIKDREEIMQFFGDKYGDLVRVVQIGGKAKELDGYSMELCGGTHVRRTSEIGLFAIKSEGANAAGIRRIEALCGEHARQHLQETAEALAAEAKQLQSDATDLAKQLDESTKSLSAKISTPDLESATAADMPKIAEALQELRKQRDSLKDALIGFKKQMKKRQAKEQAAAADEVLGEWVDTANKAIAGRPTIVESLEGDAGLLQEALNGLKKRQFKGIAVLAIIDEDAGKVHLGITVDKSLTGEFKAGDLLKELAPIVDGRGGGKPEMARGAGTDSSRLGDLLDAARERLAS